MKTEAASNEEADKQRREEVEFRNATDSLAHQVEKMLNENRDKIGSSDAEEIEKALATVRAALADGDMDRIRTARGEVEKASHRLAELMYQKTADSGDAAPDPGRPARRPLRPGGGKRKGNGAADDIIDAGGSGRELT